MISLTIDPLKYLSKLPEFSGDFRDLQTFIDLVDKIHPTLLRYDELAQSIFSDYIKAKLKGKAKEVIEINSHVTSWSDIKNTLIRNFGDRFNAEELFDELRAVKFKTNSVEFYNEIKNILRRLNVKCKQTVDEFDDLVNIVDQNKNSALIVFKNKLPEPMRSVIHCRNPQSLEEAMNVLYECNYAFYNPFQRTQQTQSNRTNKREHTRNSSSNNKPINQRSNQGFYRNDFNYNRPSFSQNRPPFRSNNNTPRPMNDVSNNSNHNDSLRFENNNNFRYRPENNNNYRFRFGNNGNSGNGNNRDRPEPMEIDLVLPENQSGELENFQSKASNTNYPI